MSNARAKYIAHTNELQELPTMDKPPILLRKFVEGTTEYLATKIRWDAYTAHLATLRTIPCSPECRGLWKPGDQLEEGKDYEVRENWDENKIGPGFTRCEKSVIAFPLSVKSEQSEDDLWYKAIDLIMVAHDKGLSKEDAVGVVKSQFIITKR